MGRNRAFGKIQEDRKKTSFFKILADEDLSSEAMRFNPQKFWRGSVCKNIPHKVILKVVWGRSWKVKLSKFMGSYLMEKNGWEKFLYDNKLGDREFLTFTNEGNNCLTVNIFEKNCKEILQPQRTTTTVIASSSSNVKKEEMSCVIAESTGRGAKRKNKRKAGNNVYGASSSSSAATFSLTIKQSHLLVLIIPNDFAKMHMPKKTAKLIIHDPKGKSWKVVYFCSNKTKIFSSGWRILARDYGLAVGDVCTFRLIKPKEMVLQVSHASP
ncbi:B3 domain-containing protein At5g18090 [Eutrema salsugineum]|uniref:B3 domain-containing protein At5g18090 n=1 Tax=Eutrema salsugineum TaxID=72664 RepID=UPI000CECE5C8|nr:B3 domain-containing protein At5g18090 [Eutrema salsugineum]